MPIDTTTRVHVYDVCVSVSVTILRVSGQVCGFALRIYHMCDNF